MRLLSALVIGVLLGLTAQPVWACDPVWLPIARPRDIAFIVATSSGAAAGGQRAHLQLVGVQLAGGAAAALPPGPIVLVPWDYREDCTPIPWKPDQVWQLPRTAAFYTGRLRPRDQWMGGVPTLDVHMAWREPLWQAAESRWPRTESTGKLLTPQEFFTLYQALPTEDALKTDPAATLAQLSAWETKHPSLAQREPARTVLANVRRAIGGTKF